MAVFERTNRRRSSFPILLTISLKRNFGDASGSPRSPDLGKTPQAMSND